MSKKPAFTAPCARKATIVDVAARAGVSIGTVSRVLNKAASRPETRQRVFEAVEALKYAPNHAAQSLKRQSTEQIAIVVPDIANPVYVAMAKAVQQAAKLKGYSLSLISTEASSREEEHALRSLERKHVDGLILCSLRPTPKLVRDLESARSRVCVIGSLPEGAEVDNVRVDSERGAAQAVGHLLAQGRRAVAFINGVAGTVPAEARLRGYERALFEHHLRPDPELTVSSDFTMAGGYGAVDGLLKGHPELEAVFCANDVMALGALRRLRELGKRVPEDIALVGMDDIDLGKISTPTLSTVALLAGERGRIAAELLFERIAGEEGDREARTVMVMPRLVVRESSTGYIVRQDSVPQGSAHHAR